MYARTKNVQNWGKMVCFWSYAQILERTCTQIKENVCKNAYLGSIFIPEKYVFRVCFESPFTRMISGLKYKCPPGFFQKVVFNNNKKVFPKGHYSEICNFILTCDFFGVKTVRNNDEPLEYRSTYMPFEGELSKLLARLLLVLLIYV